jgi:hypothetical protein
MARFYVNAYGARGETTRTGTPGSGIYAHSRGWNVGVEVRGYVQDGCDTFDIYATSGSTGGESTLLGTVTTDDEGQVVFHASVYA